MKTIPSRRLAGLVQRGLLAALFASTAVVGSALVASERNDPLAPYASRDANGFPRDGRLAVFQPAAAAPGPARVTDGGPPSTLVPVPAGSHMPGVRAPDTAPLPPWTPGGSVPQNQPGAASVVPNLSPADPAGPAAPPPAMGYAGASPVEEQLNCQPGLPAHCGFCCCPGWYADVGLLYLNRVSTNHTTLSAQDTEGMPRLGYEPGARVTIGHTKDCLLGCEFVYTGPYEWTQTAERTGPDNLHPAFTVWDAHTNISAFEYASLHRQMYQSRFQSWELNRKWFGWDVIATSLGLRYIQVDEEYEFYSEKDLDATTGLLQFTTNNHLIGPQIGLDLYYPIGCLRCTLRGRAGIYANFDNGHVSLVNAGQVEIDNSANDVQFAFQGELGYYFDYRVTKHIAVRAGYELWYLHGVALATGQFEFPAREIKETLPNGDVKTTTVHTAAVSHDTGKILNDEDDIFYHGAFLGLIVNW